MDVLGGNVHGYVSLAYLRGYDPSIDPYCIWLGDLAGKIIWTTFFNPSYDFSKAFDKVKRIPILFRVVFIIASRVFHFLDFGPRSLISSYVR